MSRVKIDLEFVFKASPAIVYQFLTDPTCLVRWFCEEADVNGEIYTFTWDGYDEDAELVDDIEEERIRMKWLDADDPSEYLEFRMYKTDVTYETILEITDFCDKDDVPSTRDLWKTQIDQLRIECGG
jgi:uncharacterized protein YndB with AHSA1/START domain